MAVQRKLTALGACLAASACLGGGAREAGAIVIDFDELVHGEVVSGQYAGQGVVITADNIGGGPDISLAFDSTLTGTNDPDLEDQFDLGNLAGATLGRLLIIQENQLGQGGSVGIPGEDRNTGQPGQSGYIPDDEGSRPAGSLFFDFTTPITEFGFDLIDVEGPEEYNRNSGFFATFFGGGAEVRVGFGLFVSPDSSFFEPGVEYGDNSANRIGPLTARELGLESMERVEINFGGSGAVDNVNYQFIPEPSFLAFGAALPLLARRRRR